MNGRPSDTPCVLDVGLQALDPAFQRPRTALREHDVVRKELLGPLDTGAARVRGDPRPPFDDVAPRAILRAWTAVGRQEHGRATPLGARSPSAAGRAPVARLHQAD